MFSIGMFSKINKVTTKTLRYYEDIGLLKPEYVDEGTKYRYYTTNQMIKLHKIITLKQMGLSLNIMAKEMMRLGCVCASPSYCFNIYHDGEYKESDIDVEICESITTLKEDSDILKFKVIDKVDEAVCILHKGPYSNLGESYSYAFKWIKENKYEVIGNPRESYIDGIWNKESEEDWLTEIQIPVKVNI